jgi:hypothetical protein
MLVHRTQISAVERQDFEQAIRNCGRDPDTFKAELFEATLAGEGATLRRVHIVAAGAAAQYEATDSSAWMHKFVRHLAMGVFG